jgi:hypothetical protein
MARLLLIGSCDARKDALHMPAKIGEQISHTSFTNQVGTGSSWHCLAADFLKIVATSSTVVSFKTESGSRISRSIITGAGKALLTHELNQFFFEEFG